MFALTVDGEVAIELAEEHHAPRLFALIDANRDHLRQWMPWVDGTRTVDDSLAFLRFIRGEYAAGRAFHANLRYGGEIVGGIGLRTDQRNRTSELGYWIDAGHQGRGIVTRAARALTAAAFDDLGMNKVTIRAGVDNTRSRAVPERLGFTYEGTLRANERLADRWVDHASYSILAGDR